MRRGRGGGNLRRKGKLRRRRNSLSLRSRLSQRRGEDRGNRWWWWLLCLLSRSRLGCLRWSLSRSSLKNLLSQRSQCCLIRLENRLRKRSRLKSRYYFHC